MTTIAMTTAGRKVHLATGRRTCCSGVVNTHPVSEVIAVLDEDAADSTADLLDALAVSKIAPSRLCAKCFYVVTRSAYAKKVSK